jgi:mannitol/fructose-specific phosphotransferase system IIA component (Ntr-type)
MHFWKRFEPQACSPSLRATEKEALLAELVTGLAGARALVGELVPRALAALVERERVASTGVGHGVAIPHVRVHGLAEAVASLSIHRRGVEWGAVDGEPVQIVFAVLRPYRRGDRHDPVAHLEFMRWVARVAHSSDFRRKALAARSSEELVEHLRGMASC